MEPNLTINEAIYHIPQVLINFVILILKAVDYEKEESTTYNQTPFVKLK